MESCQHSALGYQLFSSLYQLFFFPLLVSDDKTGCPAADEAESRVLNADSYHYA